jgi:hypothetical protein
MDHSQHPFMYLWLRIAIGHVASRSGVDTVGSSREFRSANNQITAGPPETGRGTDCPRRGVAFRCARDGHRTAETAVRGLGERSE